MKRLMTLVLLAAVGYIGYSYYLRSRNELVLRGEVRDLVGRIAWNARGLDLPQMQELAGLLGKHGFRLQPKSVRLSTVKTNDRPPNQPGSLSQFVRHELAYSYERPAALLPFRMETHEARTTQLVEVPDSGPKIGSGMGIAFP